MSTEISGVAVVNSTVDNTVIGSTTPATGNFTTVTTVNETSTGTITAVNINSSGIVDFTGSVLVPTVGTPDNSNAAASTAWARFGFAASLGTSGYVKFPLWLGGLVLQWAVGSAASGDNTQTVNWPSPSSWSACYIVFTTVFLNTTTNITKAWGVLSYDTSGATVELLRRGDEGSFSVSPYVFGIGKV